MASEVPAGCLEGVGGFWRLLRVKSFGGFGRGKRQVLLGTCVWNFVGGLEPLLGSFEIHKKSHCCGPGPGFGILEAFGAFAGWQTAALKAHRKSLLWPWPWGACWGSCLRVKVWRVWKRTRSTPAVDLRCLLGTVWRVWRVGLEFGGLAGLRAGKRGFGGFGEFWRVCGLANGSFESKKAIAVAWPWGACWGSVPWPFCFGKFGAFAG